MPCLVAGREGKKAVLSTEDLDNRLVGLHGLLAVRVVVLLLVPDGVREQFQAEMGTRGQALRQAWMDTYTAYAREYPELADHLYQMQHRRLPEGWDHGLPTFPPDPRGIAGRDASGQVLNTLAANLPWLLGGSADLAPSTKTRLTFEAAGDFTAQHYGGRNLHFGVREHAMASILNGMSH